MREDYEVLIQKKVPAVVDVVCPQTDRKYLGPIRGWKNISRYERKRFTHVDKIDSTAFAILEEHLGM